MTHLENISLKKSALSWLFYFFLLNTVFCWLITCVNIPAISPTVLRKGFSFWSLSSLCTFTGIFGYISLLSTLPFFLLAPFVWMIHRKNIMTILSVFVFTSFICLFATDAFIFFQYRFHLNGIILKIALNASIKEVLGISNYEYFFIALLIFLAVIIESFFAYFVWKHLNSFQKKIRYLPPVLFIVINLFLSFTFTIISFSNLNHFYPVISINIRIFPWYENVMACLTSPNQSQSFYRLGEYFIDQPKQASFKISYPKHPLQCNPSNKKPNVLMIVIDSWRFDMLKKEITPNLYSFSKSTTIFSNHTSGGNSTQAGIFTLFYGIPPNYFWSMQEQHVAPVFIQEILKEGYRPKILSSEPLFVTPFHENVFYGIKNLFLGRRTESAVTNDLQITNEFLNFLDHELPKGQPFFSFLFYDSAHGFCQQNHLAQIFSPIANKCNRLLLNNSSDPIPYLNRYKNSLYYVDTLVKKVLDALEKKSLLDHTIILITADHGQEFNETKGNYWGHSSNFSPYQTQVPLLVFWPGHRPKSFQYPTSHYDIAPFLMKNLFHCSNPTEDYSVGQDLLDSHRSEKGLLIGSYIGYGYKDKTTLTYIFSNGNYEILDANGVTLPTATLKNEALIQTLNLMHQFYQPN